MCRQQRATFASLQNRYANDSLVNKLADLGISNGVVTLSGRAYDGDKTITKQEFLSAEERRLTPR